MKNKEITEIKYKGGELSEAIIALLDPFFEKLSKKGIKNTIKEFVPDIDLDDFVLRKIKTQLSKQRVIELNNIYLDKVYIQYRFSGVQIEPSGIMRFAVKKITITDNQILKSFESILKQIEEKYILNREYILHKIDEIIVSLSSMEIYKPKNSREKTLYDLAMLILLNYYESNKNSPLPKWINSAIKNVSKGKFLNSWIKILIEYISEVIADVSENVFFNFKVTFDSLMVRIILDKKTNNGQISKLLKILNIDVRKIIYNFAKSYISPSFIKGIGEILADVSSYFLSTVENKKIIYDESSSEPFNITVSIGKDFNTERAFRWYTSSKIKDYFIYYSQDKEFKNFKKIKSVCEEVPKTFPFINLGLISGYKISKINKHSACIENLNPGKLYYKICTEDKTTNSPVYTLDIKNPNEPTASFIIFADSQGMIKQDYETFLKAANTGLSKNKHDFIVHLGDFVDDGNNEEYWKWVLDSKFWKENVCIPLAGNHESHRNALAVREGVENSVCSHFNVQNLPAQNTSKGIYYSFEYKNATFVVLNTNTSESGIDEIQYQYALDVFKKSKSNWKILFTHKSPYSNGPHCKDPDVKNIGNQIKELAYQGNVDLVFGGHDHVYVRTKILSYEKNAGCEEIIKSKEETTFLNPFGTIFVIPGTTGVKNYKQNLKISIPAEKIKNPQGQVYSEVSFSSSDLKFKSYEVNTNTQKVELIDSFSIKKKNRNTDSHYVSNLINSVSNVPWIDDTEKINKILNDYKSLRYQEKIKVKNSDKFFRTLKIKEKYLKITTSQICRVKTKKEFISALENPKIGTIITECEEIKFSENIFGKSEIVINRPLCIRGCAKISNINFVLEKYSLLLISDSVCIDNTRKLLSFCKSKSIFELLDNSCLIINNNASVNSSFGMKPKEKGIKISGENCTLYLNSSSCNFVQNGFIESLSPSSKIIINSGKYLSSKETILANCDLEINGGFINSIKGLETSKIKIHGGIIGKKNPSKNDHIPIETKGKLILNSGTIRCCENISVSISNEKNLIIKNENKLIKVDIEGKIIYN